MFISKIQKNLNYTNKNTGIAERVADIIAYNNISINKFALRLGYKRAQSVYDIVNGKVLPSFDFLFKFTTSELSRNINIRWLISGEGEMLIGDHTRLEEPVGKYAKNDISFNSDWRQYIESKDQKIIELAETIGQIRAELSILSATDHSQKQDNN